MDNSELNKNQKRSYWVTACVLLTCFFVSCAEEVTKDKIKVVSSKSKSLYTNSEEEKKTDLINYQDRLGRKQGEWKIYSKDQLVKREFYENNKLEGKSIEYFANGEVLETAYKNGDREGYAMLYSPNSSAAKFVTFWKENKKMWATFPNLIENSFLPDKGFINSTNKEVEIIVPYVSGETLLIGTIDKNGIPIGKHRVYYETQELKAIIDYDSDSLRIFTRTGVLEETRWLNKDSE